MRTPIVCGNARFTVYTPGCVRLEFSWGGHFSPYPSVLVGRHAPEPGDADVRQNGQTWHIKTEQLEIVYQQDEHGFTADNLRIIHKNSTGGREVWAPGKTDRGNLGTVTRSLDFWKWCGGPQKYPVEGILSTEGGHFLADEPRVYWNAKLKWPECRSHQVAFDGYFFAYGNDYKTALRDFIKVFGPIPMIPRWALGFWYSRWNAYKDTEFVELAERYRQEQIPFDVMVVDTDWRDHWGGYDWSAKYFPNPRRFFKAMQKIGVHCGVNDHPGYDNYDALPPDDSHIPAIARRLGPLPHQGQWACDWSRPDAVQTWRDSVLGPFFDQGMDFWWVDGWIKSPFGGVDSQLWANQHYYELARERTGRRGLILSRWGGIGSHRYPVQFSGDTHSEWETLRQQIGFTARSGNLGAVYWSHDIGGFMGREIDEELFIRWSQFGAMSPIFRTHSDHGTREPWKFSAKACGLFRKQARIRAALAPYLYNLVREAHVSGLPLARPLYLEYNDNDGGARGREQQYTLGRDLLVIPAEGPLDKATGCYRKRAYFPNGRWFGLETGEMYRGLDDRMLDIPLDLIPTFVREGAILPCAPVGAAIGARVGKVLYLDYYPAFDQRSALDLYEDDGESLDCERGKFSVTRVEGWRDGAAIHMVLHPPKGKYRGMPAKRRYVVRARLEPEDRLVKVEARQGRGPWRKIQGTETSTCLAGEVTSRHRFAEAQASQAATATEIRWVLS